MTTFSGSNTAMARGAVSFSTSRTQASRRCGSIVVCATVTPTYQENSHSYSHKATLSLILPTQSTGLYPSTEVVDGLRWKTPSS